MRNERMRNERMRNERTRNERMRNERTRNERTRTESLTGRERERISRSDRVGGCGVVFIIWGTRNVRSHDEISRTLSALEKEGYKMAMKLKAAWITSEIRMA
jgi:hypothetical protein